MQSNHIAIMHMQEKQELQLGLESILFPGGGGGGRKFMVGVVGHFTLQPMVCTNHKFPGTDSGRLGNKAIENSYPTYNYTVHT